MKIYTIGFTKQTAEQFFTRLKQPGLVRVIDARLNNTSQLAGFTKKNDFKFFLREICSIEYIHMPGLAPTRDILTGYKNSSCNWFTYEKLFLQLIADRRIETTIAKEVINGACLLCSEPTPEYCHRRLLAEYFRDKWEDVEICHI